MSDSTVIPPAWRAAHPRAIAPVPRGFEEIEPTRWLSFRDFAAIQIAAAMKGSGRDLSPRETAEVAYDLALALDEERARRGPGGGLGAG